MNRVPQSIHFLRGNAWFLCLVAAAAFWQGWSATHIAFHRSSLGWIEAGYRLPILATVCGAIVFLMIAASPWQPLLGMIAITSIGFGLARETPQMEWIWESGFQTSAVALATLGTLRNQELRDRLRLRWRQGQFGRDGFCCCSSGHS